MLKLPLTQDEAIYTNNLKNWIFGFEKAPGLNHQNRPNIAIWGRF
jgi:hypothetical protein